MLDNKKIAGFISKKRREKGFTQQQVAEKLNVTFQAVSKWENGVTYPNVEMLVDLAVLLGVTVDELLNAKDSELMGLTYDKAGVNILYTDSIKKDIKELIDTDNKRVLNGLGQFASLYDISFDHIHNPVLVLKAEEPGSKQKIAMEYGYTESICHDMINHLVNDIAVMGATPLAVLDTIICGNAEKDTTKMFIKGISDACRENECVLVGGELSVQPNVVSNGTYVLTSSIAGIVDKNHIIDGRKITEGDVVLAIASNGLHTNGYSLVRLLMEEMPQIKKEVINGETFIEAILRPHAPYYKCIKSIYKSAGLKGMAHITGGGIEGNLKRIMPDNLCAKIDLSKLKILPIFKHIKSNGNISDSEMLKTFNCGVGLILVTSRESSKEIMKHVSKDYNCYEIGEVICGTDRVLLSDKMNW